MSLQERIQDEIKNQLETTSGKKRRVRKFRIPAKGKVSVSKARKGYVTVIKINENGHMDFKRLQIKDQGMMEDDIPRLAANQYVMFYKKNPVIILPSWSVEPFSPHKAYQDSLVSGTNTAGYRILLATMKAELVSMKKKAAGLGMTVVGVIIAAIIGYALISGGGA